MPSSTMASSLDDDVSPVHPTSQPISDTNHDLDHLSMRADPDASATVTDFLDFTEHLPSDITRSLTLIAQLDETYQNASASVNELTTTWGKLPALPSNERADPVKLRGDVSDKLNYALSARAYAHAEACRMQDIITRHHNRIQTILHKLRVMHDNFPTIEEQALKSPVQSKSPHLVRGPKINLRVDGSAEKTRPQRIIVPGEVLGPHEIDFNFYSESSESSSEDEISVSPSRRPPKEGPRIKLVKPSRAARVHGRDNAPPVSTSTALAKLKPPPENAVPGSTDAPWLQLTQYELAKLRKRMKKNSQWIPSDTMIARELKNLGRGVEAFKEAEKKAEEEGRPFEPSLPAAVVDSDSGVKHPPEGAISPDALTADEVQLSNRGMKLNEAKKMKREILARMAAEEAEESARKMVEAARMFMNHEASPSVAGSSHDKSQETGQSQEKGSNKSKVKKRKRDSLSETPVPEKPQGAENLPAGQVSAPPPAQSDKPQVKRTKTETPVPPPQITPRPPSAPPSHVNLVLAPSVLVETPIPVPQLGRTSLTSKTPVPVPVPITVPSDSTVSARTAASSGQTSPVPSSTVTTTVPTKPPAESPAPPTKTSITPILPPVRDLPKRETRQSTQPAATNVKQPTSPRGTTPAPNPVTDQQAQLGPVRRPASRGKAASQEPPPTFAAERPRRTSTARNTPAPEIRQPSKRAKRPAPGVVTTNSGGTSAIGKRKAAPRKKARGNTKKEKGANQQPEIEAEIEVDDDGNAIDPEEPRYCLCNRVSFGTMIQCDNVDNCEKEWFHLECVGLTEIPARTTKWYCPQCRILLNIGERGEVTSRGVKM